MAAAILVKINGWPTLMDYPDIYMFVHTELAHPGHLFSIYQLQFTAIYSR